MFIRVATLVVTFAVALIGIFLNATNLGVQVALAAFAAASFILAGFVETQATRDADFTKRALERLIQASTPSNLFAEAVRQIVVDQGGRHGLGQCVVMKASTGEEDGGFIWRVIFTDQDGRDAVGYFEFDHERLAKWSLLDDSRLKQAIANEMFERGPAPTDDPEGSWNELVEFVGAIGKGLYPDAGGPVFAISANFDTVEIGLPNPPGVPPVPGRTKYLKVHGEPVPFLVFSRNDLGTLTHKPTLAASSIVAEWLRESWGTPTVLSA
jgi:hypothetical protein